MTVCTSNRRCLFGDVIDGELSLNDAGRVVETALRQLEHNYPSLTIDRFVVMPNHLHALLVLNVQAATAASAGLPAPAKPLGQLVGAFKATTTRLLREQLREQDAAIWQRGYYEHVLRGATDLARIRRYIEANPRNWPADPEHPDNGNVR